MKRFLILLLSVNANALYRTFSIHPAIDSVKIALMNEDTEALEERLKNCLPFALDRQYALLGIPTSVEAQNLLLNAIRDYWINQVVEHPASGLSSLLFNVQLLGKSYQLDELDYRFKKMLSSLQRTLSRRTQLRGSQQLLAQFNSLCSFNEPETLLTRAADVIVQAGIDQVDLPEECIEQLRQMRPPINVVLPLTPTGQ